MKIEKKAEPKKEDVVELIKKLVDEYNLDSIKKQNLTPSNYEEYYNEYVEQFTKISKLLDKVDDPIEFIKELPKNLGNKYVDVTKNFVRRLKAQLKKWKQMEKAEPKKAEPKKAESPIEKTELKSISFGDLMKSQALDKFGNIVKEESKEEPKPESKGKNIRDEEALDNFYENYKGVKSKRAFNSLKKNLEAVSKNDEMYEDVLDELMDVKMKNFFPTPADCLHKRAIVDELKQAEHVLEPTAGLGSMLFELYKFNNKPDLKVKANELNKPFVDFLKWNYPNANVSNEDFLEQKVEKNDYDLILMNPPFTNERTRDKRYYLNFLMKALAMMDKFEKGYSPSLIMVAPKIWDEKHEEGEQIMNLENMNSVSNKKKQELMKQYKEDIPDADYDNWEEFIDQLPIMAVTVMNKCEFKTTGVETWVYLIQGTHGQGSALKGGKKQREIYHNGLPAYQTPHADVGARSNDKELADELHEFIEAQDNDFKREEALIGQRYVGQRKSIESIENEGPEHQAKGGQQYGCQFYDCESKGLGKIMRTNDMRKERIEKKIAKYQNEKLGGIAGLGAKRHPELIFSNPNNQATADIERLSKYNVFSDPNNNAREMLVQMIQKQLDSSYRTRD